MSTLSAGQLFKQALRVKGLVKAGGAPMQIERQVGTQGSIVNAVKFEYSSGCALGEAAIALWIDPERLTSTPANEFMDLLALE